MDRPIDSVSHITSTLAVRPFASAREAVETVLAAAVSVLGMKSAFLTHVEEGSKTLRVLASANTDESFVVPAGLELPLDQSP